MTHQDSQHSVRAVLNDTRQTNSQAQLLYRDQNRHRLFSAAAPLGEQPAREPVEAPCTRVFLTGFVLKGRGLRKAQIASRSQTFKAGLHVDGALGRLAIPRRLISNMSMHMVVVSQYESWVGRCDRVAARDGCGAIICRSDLTPPADQGDFP
jgi:hypothetical protein